MVDFSFVVKISSNLIEETHSFIYEKIKVFVTLKGDDMENEKYLILSQRHKAEIQSYLPEDRDILKLALYFQNFSDSTRLKILSCLSFCDLCVNDLSNLLNINQTTISHQLKTLKDQNLVTYKRNGKMFYFKIFIYKSKKNVIMEEKWVFQTKYCWLC